MTTITQTTKTFTINKALGFQKIENYYSTKIEEDRERKRDLNGRKWRVKGMELLRCIFGEGGNKKGIFILGLQLVSRLEATLP